MTADTVGGVWTYAVELSRALNAAGLEVMLATMGRPLTASQLADLRDLNRTELAESAFRLEWMPDCWQDVDRAGSWLLDVADRFRPDVVHLSSMSHGALPWPCPVLVVAHSCVLSWWAAVRGWPVPPEFDEYARRIRRGLHAAHRVVAPTTCMLDAVRRHYGPLGHGTVVWNGRAPEVFAPLDKEFVVFGAGRLWDPGKNLEALDRIAPRLSWPVVLAGERQAPDGQRLTLHHARWMGVLTDAEIRRAMGRAAVYALPARYEPFGLSALEAALSGCALVLSDIPSLRELWDGIACFVPADDDEALAYHLQRIIDDAACRQQMGRAALARGRTLTASRMARAYVTHYDDLMRLAA